MKKTSIALLCLILGAPTWGRERPADPAQGAILYRRYCLSCHGERGDGHGESAEWLNPKPRDYRLGIFKWRSTPTGTLPLDSDLAHTIENGVYGTSMPPWYPIGPYSTRDLIAYVQTFSPRWQTEKRGTPVEIPPEPPDTQASVQSGHALYNDGGCAECHGESGTGDGPSGRNLKDAWGFAIQPADLTTGHIKCGNTPADIYRVLVTGLDGTPMPSFAASLSPEQTWDLVHYIRSLRSTTPELTLPFNLKVYWPFTLN